MNMSNIDTTILRFVDFTFSKSRTLIVPNNNRSFIKTLDPTSTEVTVRTLLPSYLTRHTDTPDAQCVTS